MHLKPHCTDAVAKIEQHNERDPQKEIVMALMQQGGKIYFSGKKNGKKKIKFFF